jgi:hypothetical protein
MSKIIIDNKTTITHGKALKKYIADSFSTLDYNYLNYFITSWTDRADKPHKCNVDSCPLFKMYLRDKFWKIGTIGLVYNESKKFLKRHLPNDIVLFILKKCFT